MDKNRWHWDLLDFSMFENGPRHQSQSSHKLVVAILHSQQNSCHIGQKFPPLMLTGPIKSARNDTQASMQAFVIDEVPTQPTNEKQCLCPI